MQTLKNWLFYLTATPFIYLSTLLASEPALAAINKPKLPDGSAASDNIVGDLGKVIQGIGTFVLYLILVAGYVVAAYLVINGAWSMFKEREGGVAKFFLGVFIAIVMVLMTTYFLSEGETALQNFNTGA